MEKGTAIAIIGPTASGKSEVAIELAHICGGEVVTADSMQVYRHMDIGTAKPCTSSMRGIAHHMIDVCEPDEPMSVAKYCELAKEAIKGIRSRGHLPIIAGGTGLYIDALTRGFLFPDDSADNELRARLYERAETEGGRKLHEELSGVDPEAASRIHANDTRRVVRALEVFAKAGKPISDMRSIKPLEQGIPSIVYGLGVERAKLVERIDLRVEKMMESGLREEVADLIRMGYGGCKVAMQAIGYKELIAHLKGELTVEEAVGLIKTETRQYAKRQMTWFRKNKEIKWFDASSGAYMQIAEDIFRDYSSRGTEVQHIG